MSLSRYMDDTITIIRETGVNSYGDPTFAAAFTAKARVERATRLISHEGSSIRVEWVVATETEIRVTDRVQLPCDDWSSEGRRPVLVRYAAAPRGAGFYEVSF